MSSFSTDPWEASKHSNLLSGGGALSPPQLSRMWSVETERDSQIVPEIDRDTVAPVSGAQMAKKKRGFVFSLKKCILATTTTISSSFLHLLAWIPTEKHCSASSPLFHQKEASSTRLHVQKFSTKQSQLEDIQSRFQWQKGEGPLPNRPSLCQSSQVQGLDYRDLFSGLWRRTASLLHQGMFSLSGRKLVF